MDYTQRIDTVLIGKILKCRGVNELVQIGFGKKINPNQLISIGLVWFGFMNFFDEIWTKLNELNSGWLDSGDWIIRFFFFFSISEKKYSKKITASKFLYKQILNSILISIIKKTRPDRPVGPVEPGTEPPSSPGSFWNRKI